MAPNIEAGCKKCGNYYSSRLGRICGFPVATIDCPEGGFGRTDRQCGFRLFSWPIKSITSIPAGVTSRVPERYYGVEGEFNVMVPRAFLGAKGHPLLVQPVRAGRGGHLVGVFFCVCACLVVVFGGDRGLSSPSPLQAGPRATPPTHSAGREWEAKGPAREVGYLIRSFWFGSTPGFVWQTLGRDGGVWTPPPGACPGPLRPPPWRMGPRPPHLPPFHASPLLPSPLPASQGGGRGGGLVRSLPLSPTLAGWPPEAESAPPFRITPAGARAGMDVLGPSLEDVLTLWCVDLSDALSLRTMGFPNNPPRVQPRQVFKGDHSPNLFVWEGRGGMGVTDF